MKKIGNYRDWIKQEWLDHLLAHSGTVHPFLDGPYGGGIIDTIKEVDYNIGGLRWQTYCKEEGNMPFDITPPIDTGVQCEFWFVKLLPGDTMIMHRDYDLREDLTAYRYWMPLQDQIPGHIFAYENTVISEYKAGDIHMFDNSNGLHGVVNLGYVPRLTVNITVYK